MKRTHFYLEPDGFYGTYWRCRELSGCTIIALAGDAPEDYLARACVKWFLGKGVNVLSMSTAKKDCGYHNYPLERIEAAICRLRSMDISKTGIVGVSTTGTIALAAASYFRDITLTVALTPTDFIWQGVMQSRRDGCKEWPAEGESLLSYCGEPLPYMPFVCQHPQYWRSVAAESRRTGDMIYARKLYEDSETAHPITEAETIKVEDIRGKLLLIGAKDDVLWNTAKYIRRMEKRLAEKPHDCKAEAVIYEHGTHFVFPEGMMKLLLPIGSALAIRLAFKAAGAYPEECRAARVDIDRRITQASNGQKLEDLKAEYQVILERLDELEQQGVIGAFDKRTIIDLSGDVINEIAQKYENVQKGVGDIMRGALLETSARTILNQGISQNQRETALRMLKRGKMTIQEIAEDTGLNVAEVEQLAGLQTV